MHPDPFPANCQNTSSANKDNPAPAGRDLRIEACFSGARGRHMEPLRLTMRKTVFLLLVISMAAYSTGCAPRKALLLGDDYSSPGRALAKLRQMDAGEQTLKAVSTLTATGTGGRYTVKMALLAKRPCYLRVEEMPFLGLPDLFLSANEDRLKVFYPKEGKFYVGKPTRENISKFLPWGIEVEEFLALLFGMPPPCIAAAERLEGRAEGDLYRIDAIESGGKIGSLWIDPMDHRLVRTEILTEKGDVLCEVSLASYGPAGDLIIPKELTLDFFKPEGTNILIRHRSTEITTDEEEDLFDLEIPIGITPLQLD